MATKKSSEQTGSQPVRNYACIVYPESAPENWKDILSGYLVPAFISPLHEDDVNPTGEPKKPHYHVILMFQGKKTFNHVKELFETFGGVGCEVVNSIRGYARYLCHLDNPEKAQYDPSKVCCICGSDYMTTIGLATDKYVALGEMMDFCDTNKVVSFFALAKYARSHRPDWHRILCDSGSIFMREYLRSMQWSIENNQCEIIDQETGEKLV